MYLVNKRTGTRIYLAKYYPSTGWYAVAREPEESFADKINRGFHEADFGHLSLDERAANARHRGLGVPHPSPAGMWGDEWALEYEQTAQPMPDPPRDSHAA